MKLLTSQFKCRWEDNDEIVYDATNDGMYQGVYFRAVSAMRVPGCELFRHIAEEISTHGVYTECMARGYSDWLNWMSRNYDPVRNPARGFF